MRFVLFNIAIKTRTAVQVDRSSLWSACTLDGIKKIIYRLMPFKCRLIQSTLCKIKTYKQLAGLGIPAKRLKCRATRPVLN